MTAEEALKYARRESRRETAQVYRRVAAWHDGHGNHEEAARLREKADGYAPADEPPGRP